MVEIFEAAILKETTSPVGDRLKTRIELAGAFSEKAAQGLKCKHLYRSGHLVSDIRDGSLHKESEIPSARVQFYGMPGTAIEDTVLLTLPECSVSGFSLEVLGNGGRLWFHVDVQGMNQAIGDFMAGSRGWTGKVVIEELQKELEEGESPSNLPRPSGKRGRAQQEPLKEATPVLVPPPAKSGDAVLKASGSHGRNSGSPAATKKSAKKGAKKSR